MSAARAARTPAPPAATVIARASVDSAERWRIMKEARREKLRGPVAEESSALLRSAQRLLAFEKKAAFL